MPLMTSEVTYVLVVASILSWHGQGFRLPKKLEYQKQRTVVCKIQLAQLDAEQGFYNGKTAVKLRVVSMRHYLNGL